MCGVAASDARGRGVGKLVRKPPLEMILENYEDFIGKMQGRSAEFMDYI